MNAAIKIVNLCKSFQKEEILKNIHHEFEKGKTHGIVGFNGSGKTVLFKCICGFYQPTSGCVVVDGQIVGKEIDFPKSLGIIIENPGFLPEYSGAKNLLMLGSIKGKISHEQICNVMVKVGLDPQSKKHVGRYSLGMRERLGIAQAIMEDPDILILDEPFNGLDKRGVQEVYKLIMELKENGKTILLASHNAVDIETLCDTVCEIDGGVLTPVK